MSVAKKNESKLVGSGDGVAETAIARGPSEVPSSVHGASAFQTLDALLSRDDIERETGGGVTRRWLELAAHKGLGPPMIKISRRCVRYRRSEFLAWLDACRIAPEDAR